MGWATGSYPKEGVCHCLWLRQACFSLSMSEGK